MKKPNVNVLGKLLFAAIMFGLLLSAPAQADEATDARIEKLEAALKNLQTELAELKAERVPPRRRPAVNQKRIDSMVSKAIDKNKGELGLPDWVQRIKLYGDFRFRYEYMNDDTDDTIKQNRNRIRARIGLNAKLDEEWDLGFRIATGSSDTATSTNQTLDDSFEEKDLWLDLAYADYHPESLDGLNVIMGKMKNPFYKVGKNQVIWDGDVNPEGGAFKYTVGLGESDVLHLNGAALWLDEREAAADSSIFGIQSYVKHSFDDDSHLVAGASYYDFGNIDNHTLDGIGILGNTPTTPGGTIYKYDYDILEGFAEYGFKCHGMPVAVFGNYVENLAASNDNNTAYLVGVKLNTAKKPGSWQAGYSYRDVESDAVLGGLTDSDFIDGGTNGKGHKLGFKYQLTKNVQTGVTYFDTDKGSSDDDFKRLQLDMIFKF